MPPKPAAFLGMQLLARLRALALLVGNAAAGLAGRLAGSLAFAAAAVLGAFAQVTGFQSLDMLHNSLTSSRVYFCAGIVIYSTRGGKSQLLFSGKTKVNTVPSSGLL